MCGFIYLHVWFYLRNYYTWLGACLEKVGNLEISFLGNFAIWKEISDLKEFLGNSFNTEGKFTTLGGNFD